MVKKKTKSKQEPKPRPPKNSWNRELARVLKTELAREDIGYKDLARRLKDLGVSVEEDRSLCNRVNRGAFSAIFFIQCLRALGHGDAKFIVNEPSTGKAALSISLVQGHKAGQPSR